jgi:hypothetical protein
MPLFPLAAMLLATAPVAAETDGAKQEPPVTISVGIKTGGIPPVLVAPELVLHWEYIMVGAFAMYTTTGAGRWTVGGELGYEVAGAGKNTPYLLGAIFHYSAETDAAGRYERTDVATLTAGYEWKWRHFELQFGLGALFILKDELQPCSDFFCYRPDIRVLPTFDLSGRYRF